MPGIQKRASLSDPYVRMIRSPESDACSGIGISSSTGVPSSAIIEFNVACEVSYSRGGLSLESLVFGSATVKDHY